MSTDTKDAQLPTFKQFPLSPAGEALTKRVMAARVEAMLALKAPTHVEVGADLISRLPWPDKQRIPHPTTTICGLQVVVVPGEGVQVSTHPVVSQ